MLSRKKFIWIGLFTFCAVPALSYEVDNFTDRESLTRDAAPVLDDKVNHYIQRAVNEANEESPRHCNKVLLRQDMLRWVRPDPVSVFELWATYTDKIQQIKTPVKNSIYWNASFIESPAIWVAGIGRSFKLGDHIIGTDKLGHFFMQGHEYFMNYLGGEDLDHILEFDHHEDGIYGLSATGVKSYADMSANYQGFLFWTHFYEGQNPYVRCEDGKKWVKVRNFTWTDYVSDAWDEAINCSEFLPTLAPKVKRNLEKIGKTCPIKPDACWSIAHLEKSKFFMSPACQAVVHQAAKKDSSVISIR